MPVEYEIDESRRLVITKGTGAISDAELFACRERIEGDPRFRPDFDQLGDYRGVTTVGVTTDGIRRLAERPFLRPGSRKAYIADSDASFGLLRMFQILRGDTSELVAVFRDEVEAMAWLARRPGIPVPVREGGDAGTE